METGTEEYMRQKFGHSKTKGIFAFDEGCAKLTSTLSQSQSSNRNSFSKVMMF